MRKARPHLYAPQTPTPVPTVTAPLAVASHNATLRGGTRGRMSCVKGAAGHSPASEPAGQTLSCAGRFRLGHLDRHSRVPEFDVLDKIAPKVLKWSRSDAYLFVRCQELLPCLPNMDRQITAERVVFHCVRRTTPCHQHMPKAARKGVRQGGHARKGAAWHRTQDAPSTSTATGGG